MRIAVTGAGGRLGGQVVDLLAADGRHDVVAVVRRPLSDPPRPRVEAARADYEDPTTLRAALENVDTLVFVSSDGETHHMLRHHDNVVRAAVSGEVGHVVVLSSLDSDLGSPFCYAVTNRQTELLLESAGCSLSIARASIYTEFFARWLTDARASGELRLPAAAGRISLVSREDVGRTLAALALGEPTGRRHDLTGPEALDLATMAGRLARAVGTPIHYVDLPPDEYVAEMAQDGLDPWWAYAFSSMFASVREQRWSTTSDEIAVLTGRPPLSLDDVIARDVSPTAGR